MRFDKKMAGVTAGLILVVSLVGSSCSRVVPFITDTVPSFVEDVVTDIIMPEAPEHTIDLGEEVDLGSQTVETSGGTVDVDDPGDPLDGLQIEVPPDAYGESRQFDISYAPITGHDFDDNFDPVTPLITVENGGGYADDFMYVTIPVDVPEGSFAMAFYFDAATGKLEGIPPVSETPESITVVTRHFTDFLGSLVDESVLTRDIDCDFLPGEDDWQFVNRGSFIAPKGHCAGQALSAMWYYCEETQNGAPQLYDLYDNNGNVATPDLWQDDSWGYRLASSVQKSINWQSFENKFMADLAGVDDELTYKAFAYAMLLTGEPQEVGIFNTTVGGGHDMICYRVADDTLYIADPNYPGNLDRKIELVNGKFNPYNSGANAREIAAGRGKAYDAIEYCAKTATIEWGKITECWEQFYNGTAGNDRFPAYNIKIQEDDGTIVDYTEGFKTESEAVWINIESRTAGTNLSCWVWESGVRLDPGPQGYVLSSGRNQWGLEVVGEAAGGAWDYVDFVYVDIYTADLYIEPAAVDGQPGDTVEFTAHTDDLPANARFEWDFSDGTPGEDTTTDQVSHRFNDSGHYTVRLTLYDEDTGDVVDQATAEVSIMPESKDLLGLLHTFGTFNLTFNSTNTYQDWLVGEGESTDTNNYGLTIPLAWGGGTMDIIWEGTTFTGTLLHGDPDYMGRVDEISGNVSPDGTTVESVVFSHRFRDEGTNWVSNRTVNMEFTNMPLDWYTGSETEQSELKCDLHGSEVESHVTRVEYHSDTFRNGELESSRDYVSTDWSQPLSLYVQFNK